MPRYMRGLLGNGQGKVAVPDRPGFCYVRPSRSTDDVIEVFNKEVSGGDGTTVLVGELPWQPGLTQIVSVDWETYIQVGWGDGYAGVALHGKTHEWNDGFVGTDAFNVFRRQIAPMRTYPVGSGSHSVNIAPYDYIYAGSPISWCGLPGLDLSPAVPATGTARLMLTYLDMESNVAGVVTGSIDVDSDAIELSRPALPTGTWAPSAYVKLYGGQPGILERDISDARQLWAGMSATPSGPAGGDLTGSYPNPLVVGLDGQPIRSTTPAEGYGLMYTGSAWSPIPWPGTTGPAGGDLTGTYPNPTVIGLQTYPVLDTVPAAGYGLMYTGSMWRPIPWPSGGGSPTGPAGGDLTGTYPNPLVVGLYDRELSAVAPGDGDAYIFDIGTSLWTPGDHGDLGGLADDDHAQYLLVDGTRAMTGELEADLGISIPTGQDLWLNDGEDTGIACPSPYNDRLRLTMGGSGIVDFYVTGSYLHEHLLTNSGGWQLRGYDAGGSTKLMILALPDTTVQLHYDGATRLNTSADGLLLPATTRIDFNSSDDSIRASAAGQLDFEIAGTDVGYFEADGLNIEGRILKTVWFFPGLTSEYVTGQYFNDNDASYPAGWTEDDAAAATNTNTYYGFWYLRGTSSETSWQYSYDTSFDLENDAGANDWTAWLFGPIFWQDGQYGADLDYLFGVYGSTGGVMDINTYNRVRLHWDSGTSVWQIQGETRAGATDSETASGYSTFTFLLHQPIWIIMVIRNNAGSKTCRNYIQTAPFEYVGTIMSNVNESTTWGNLHLMLEMDRGAGINNTLYIGMWDSFDMS